MRISRKNDHGVAAPAALVVPSRLWRVAVPAVVVVVVSVVGLLPKGPAHAIQDDVPALGSAGQVRIFGGGVRLSGTLVDRNWVLTADHGRLGDGTGAHLIFGQVNNANDADPAHRRAVDRVVRPEGGGVDLALVHFADPVPEGTFIPDLAATAPGDYAPAHSYGWDGGVLGRLTTTILRPTALDAFRQLRDIDPELVLGFTEAAPPMTTNMRTDPGDSGGGTFSPWNVLAGVHVGNLEFEESSSNGSAGPSHRAFLATFEQPVWEYRGWIRSVINGASPAPTPSPAPPGGSERRRLDTSREGNLVMTLPPQQGNCDPGVASCTVSEPVWARGVLLGGGNYRGTALARCASAGARDCSFDGTFFATGQSARMSLGPSSAKSAAGTREVMVWCKTTTPFPEANSPTQQVVEVSFTNGDPRDSPLGYGWWYVTPDQVGTGSGQTLVDIGPLATC